jgi:hypothetical protein
MDAIETAEGYIEVHAVNDGIEVYTCAAGNDDVRESVDLILTREQAAALVARLAAVLAETP